MLISNNIKKTFITINSRFNYQRYLIYFFFFASLSINIGVIYITLKYFRNKDNNINISNLSSEQILKLKNNLAQKVSNLEEILRLKEREQNLKQSKTKFLNMANEKEIISVNNNISDTNSIIGEEFNQNINEKYIQAQRDFCDNQIKYYNQEYENKIKLVNAKFNDLKFDMFVYKKNDYVSRNITNTKEWEGDSTRKIIYALNYFLKKKNIKKEDVYILDIGENIGWYTFCLAKLGYKIIGFEPSSINNYILKKTYCLNKELNITLINKGLYNEEKQCGIYNTYTNEGNGFTICDKKKIRQSYIRNETIILTKLSNYIPFLSDKNLALIKIDIEGSEGKAFEGGIELITKYHVPFILLEYCFHMLKDEDTDPKQFLQIFLDNGYKINKNDFFEETNYTLDYIIQSTKKVQNFYIVYKKILDNL